MIKLFTPILLSIILPLLTTAQQQISVGAGYSLQAYYDLETGEVVQVPNDVWDIAFSAVGQQDAGVFINESTTFMASPMSLFIAEGITWEENISDLSPFVDSVALFNPEADWTTGAFNSIKNAGNPLDFGWGSYDPQSHTIVGDKVFVLQKKDGTFIKFQVTQLAGSTYSIRYADLDGSNEITADIAKADADGALVYYSFLTHDIVEMPSAYDLIFKRYTTPLDDGAGGIIQYTVTGVLQGPGVEAVVADGVEPTSASFLDYEADLSTSLSTIGHDWKAFDFTVGWVVDEDRTHFVKTASGDVYQVTFYDFEGSSTGTTTLEATYVTSVSTEENIHDIDIALYPNPTTDYFLVNGLETSTRMELFSATGNLVLSSTITNDEHIDIHDLPTGTYLLKLQSDFGYHLRKLMVK